MQQILGMDAFRRLPVDLTEATRHGAYLSIAAYSICALLFILELHSYLTYSLTKTTELDSHYEDDIWIDFDITMNELPCKYTKVVVRDVIGHQELPILDKTITKTRLSVDDGSHKGWHSDEIHKRRHNLESDESDESQESQESHPELDADWISTSDEFKHTDFDAVIRYHDFTFINFYAEWCVHCRRFAPIWIEAENKADKTQFYDKNDEKVVAKLLRINCVQFKDVCTNAGIRGFPTIRMYKKDGTFGEYWGKRKVDDLLKSVTDFIHENEVIHHSSFVSHHNQVNEGCRVHGKLNIRRVPGYFLLEADSEIDSLDASMTNVSHNIKHLIFTDDEPNKYSEQVDAYTKKLGKHLTRKVARNLQYLNKKSFTTDKKHSAPEHFMRVVRTKLDNDAVVYQAAVQSHVMDIDNNEIPQARFSYQFSPITIKFSTAGKSFYEFMTSVFAIVGGTFTFVSLIHRMVDSVDKKFKSNINKLG